MSNNVKAPCLTSAGVEFTVTVDYKIHDCMVSSEALSSLCHSVDKNLDLLATYGAFAAKINGVARRMVMAGVNGSPLLLAAQNFN